MKAWSVLVCAAACMLVFAGCATVDIQDRLRLELVKEFVGMIPNSVLRDADGNRVAISVIQSDVDDRMVSALGAKLTQDGRFVLAERQDEFLKAIRREIDTGHTDYFDHETVAPMGKFYGAQFLVMGRLWALQTRFFETEVAADLKFVHTGRAAVLLQVDRGELRRRYRDWMSLGLSVGALAAVVLIVFLWIRSSRKRKQHSEDVFRKTMDCGTKG